VRRWGKPTVPVFRLLHNEKGGYKKREYTYLYIKVWPSVVDP
jgi:hypothetical protein